MPWHSTVITNSFHIYTVDIVLMVYLFALIFIFLISHWDHLIALKYWEFCHPMQVPHLPYLSPGSVIKITSDMYIAKTNDLILGPHFTCSVSSIWHRWPPSSLNTSYTYLPGHDSWNLLPAPWVLLLTILCWFLHIEAFSSHCRVQVSILRAPLFIFFTHSLSYLIEFNGFKNNNF